MQSDAETALAAFNRPRKILGLMPFVQRIGIATGEVVLGNVACNWQAQDILIPEEISDFRY